MSPRRAVRSTTTPGRSLLPIGLALCLLSMISTTATRAAAGPTWTIDDILHTETVDGIAASRDGHAIAWIRTTVETVDKVEKRVGNLWLTRLSAASGAKPASIQLTRGRDRMSDPAFAPDGHAIAFLSERKIPGAEEDEVEGNQVWIIPTGGGEAFAATHFDRPVGAFGWIDAETLVVAAPEAKSAWELERKKHHDEAQVVDDADHTPPVRLYRVAAEPGGKVTRVTGNEDWIDSLAVAPDGRRAVVTAQQSLSYQFDSKVPPVTRLVDLTSGAAETLFTEPFDGHKLLPSAIRWQPGGGGFYFVDEFTTDPRYRNATVSRLYHYDLTSGATERVDLGWDRGLGRGYDAVPGGVVALLADGVRDRLVRIDRRGGGWTKTELSTEQGGTLDGLLAEPDGATLIYQQSAATEPPQLYAAPLAASKLGAPVQISELNKSFADKPKGRVEVVHFTGARGDTVEGLLYYPLDWTEGGAPAPLFLDIHGGPASRDRDAWDQRWPAPSLLWRQRGAFVLQVNYHGSTGYGLDWVESIQGHYYELETPDLLAGVDWVIAQGLADPDRLASIGWSNGGILTADLITRTNRFKAASVGAADVEWISDWANVAFGASFDNYYFGGPPWEATQTYLEKSPFFRLTEVTTPTIIYTGTKDTNVPPHQSWSLFRALQQIDKAPARLVIFPGEPHGLRKISDQRRKMQEDLDWLDRYIFAPDAAKEEIEAVRPGTLLAGLMDRAGAAATDGAVGVTKDGALVPETVPFAGRTVGRFEVTRAQWAAFDPSATVAPGEENLPVTGVSFERAKEYAEWLARATGRAFRLPTVEEAEELAKAAGSAGKGGNTLDRWAGYTPNPDDAAAIRQALEEKVGASTGAPPLLLPVGSLPGAKATPDGKAVFDLDGNAAEWAVGEDGAGKPVGPSADRSTDARGDGGEPGAAYVGLRVVVEGE